MHNIPVVAGVVNAFVRSLLEPSRLDAPTVTVHLVSAG